MDFFYGCFCCSRYYFVFINTLKIVCIYAGMIRQITANNSLTVNRVILKCALQFEHLQLFSIHWSLFASLFLSPIMFCFFIWFYLKIHWKILTTFLCIFRLHLSIGVKIYFVFIFFMRKFVQTFARFVFNLIYLVDFMSTLGAIVLVVELVGANTRNGALEFMCE